MDLYDNVVTLLVDRHALSGGQKAFVGVQLAIAILVFVFLLILVFFPSTYGLNAAGIWMSRLALGGLILSAVMNKVFSKIAADIKVKKAAQATQAAAAVAAVPTENP
jgi:hypothetical protein